MKTNLKKLQNNLDRDLEDIGDSMGFDSIEYADQLAKNEDVLAIAVFERDFKTGTKQVEGLNLVAKASAEENMAKQKQKANLIGQYLDRGTKVPGDFKLNKAVDSWAKRDADFVAIGENMKADLQRLGVAKDVWGIIGAITNEIKDGDDSKWVPRDIVCQELLGRVASAQ